MRRFRLLFAVLMAIGLLGVWMVDQERGPDPSLVPAAAAAEEPDSSVSPNDPRYVPAEDDTDEPDDPAQAAVAPADETASSVASATPTTSPPLNLNSVPANSGTGKRIIYSNSGQRVWIVDANDNLVRAFLVSGKKGVPTPGTYHVMSQSRWTQSKFVTPVIHMEYMTRFAISPNRKNNIGFHAIPSRDGKVMQTEAQLGTYQSGGCIRMTKDNAIFIFNWATTGTKVVVLA